MGNNLTTPITETSTDFPYIDSKMSWTSPDEHTNITVQRTRFTWTVTTYQGIKRIDDQCGIYATEQAARATARMWAEMATAAAQPATAPATRTLSAAYPTVPAASAPRPVAAGHSLDMSDVQALAILTAGCGGTIQRGASKCGGVPTGKLTTTQIDALHLRGWAVRITAQHPKHPRRRITVGAVVTAQGWARAS
jgi:hypothetical protein